MKIDQARILTELYKKDPAAAQKEMLTLGIDLSSVYQEMEMSSRFVNTHMDISYGNIPVNLHSHSFYEIIYILTNSGIQYLVGTKRYSLQRGDIVIVPPGIGHKPLFPAQLAEPYKRIVLWVSMDFIDIMLQLLPSCTLKFSEKMFLLRTLGTPYEYFGELFHRGLNEAEKQHECWQIALYGNTFQILAACIRAFANPEYHTLSSEKPELLDDVVAYIESHLSEKLTLSDTAQRFFVSESTIGQTFQKKMHISFYRFVTQRRLIAAKSMILKEQNLDILSTRVGFSDYSTFYRAFKKEFGISPREYRNLIAENQQNLI